MYKIFESSQYEVLIKLLQNTSGHFIRQGVFKLKDYKSRKFGMPTIFYNYSPKTKCQGKALQNVITPIWSLELERSPSEALLIRRFRFIGDEVSLIRNLEKMCSWIIP